jgi:DNA-binding NarL/FixJ family response regulator
MLEARPGFEICAEFSAAREAIDAIPGLNPDLVVTEIALPDISGLELIKELQARCSGVRVLVFSAQDEMLYAERVIRAGGCGYLMKHTAVAVTVRAIEHVLGGNVHLSQKMSNHMLGSLAGNGHSRPMPHLNLLTDRELEVFDLIGRGRNTHEISDQLCICLRTVEAHRTHIREKLQLGTAADVIRHAVLWVESPK